MRARSLQPPILPYNRIGAWCQPCRLSGALFNEAHFVLATSRQRPSLHQTGTSITVGDSECCSATESVVREMPAIVLAGTQLGYLKSQAAFQLGFHTPQTHTLPRSCCKLTMWRPPRRGGGPRRRFGNRSQRKWGGIRRTTQEKKSKEEGRPMCSGTSAHTFCLLPPQTIPSSRNSEPAGHMRGVGGGGQVKEYAL